MDLTKHLFNSLINTAAQNPYLILDKMFRAVYSAKNRQGTGKKSSYIPQVFRSYTLGVKKIIHLIPIVS